MIKNTILLDALRGKNHCGRPPVWLMRQAGRYMPEYRKIRGKYSFLEMCHTPEIAAEITLQPIKAFDMDAAILFSDILVIPEALDVGLRFEDSVGPIIENPLTQPSDIARLPKYLACEKLNYVADAIKILKKELEIPLIGFAGGPFTIASYMIEGGSSKSLQKTKKWMIQNPKSFHALLQKLTDDTIDYVKLQIEAGVNAVQIFDSWAHVLSHNHFKEFSLYYLEQISNAIKSMKTPSILFCKGSSVFAKDLSEINPTAVSLDWNASLKEIRKNIPSEICLQGNLDPDILYADAKVLESEVQSLLRDMDSDPSYIFNLGHGISPDVSPDSVKTLVNTIKNYKIHLK